MKKVFRSYVAMGAMMAIAALFYSNDTQAQQRPRAGIKGGLNAANLYSDDVDDKNLRYGFHAGVYAQILSSDVFAIQPEVNYSAKGLRFETTGLIDQETKFNLEYIDIPVLAVFKLGEVAEIHAGPYISYLVGASIKTEGDLGNDYNGLGRDNFENWDYGLTGGVGFNVGAVQLGARYNLGLQKIAKSNGAEAALGDAKNSVGQIYIALNFNQSE